MLLHDGCYAVIVDVSTVRPVLTIGGTVVLPQVRSAAPHLLFIELRVMILPAREVPVWVISEGMSGLSEERASLECSFEGVVVVVGEGGYPRLELKPLFFGSIHSMVSPKCHLPIW